MGVKKKKNTPAKKEVRFGVSSFSFTLLCRLPRNRLGPPTTSERTSRCCQIGALGDVFTEEKTSYKADRLGQWVTLMDELAELLYCNTL